MHFRCRTNQDRKPNINWGSIHTYFERWKPYTDFDIEITRISKKKIASVEQRGYYFDVVLPALMQGCGYDPEEEKMVHRHLKCTFFRVRPDEHGIYREKDIPSVFSLESDIGMSKRCDFIDWVIRKATEQGEEVPPPKK